MTIRTSIRSREDDAKKKGCGLRGVRGGVIQRVKRPEGVKEKKERRRRQ